jgi:hypothetical protein
VGNYDDFRVLGFYSRGGIEEVLQEAEKMKAGAAA